MSILRISSQIMLATSLTMQVQVHASVYQDKKREVHAVDQKGASDEQAFFIGALSRNKCTENDKRRSTYPSRLTMQLTVMSSRQKSICKEVGIVCGSEKGSKLLSYSGHENIGQE